MNGSGRIGLWSAVTVVAATWALLTAGWAAAGIVHSADADTVGLWHLDETAADGYVGGRDFHDSSANALDAFGYDITATQIVMGVSGVTGGSDKAVDMRGGDAARNLIESGSVASYFNGGNFTLETWIRNPGLLNTGDALIGRLIGWIRDGAIQLSLGVTTNGGLKMYSNNGSGFAYATEGRAWTTDTWYYVALVSDTNGQASGKALYTVYRRPLNGALSVLETVVTNAVTSVSGATIEFASPQSAGNRDFYGQMDELHFSKVARSFDYLDRNSTTSTVVNAFRVHVPDWESVVLWHLDETVAVNSETLPDVEDAGFYNNPGRAYRDGLDRAPQTVFLNTNGVAGAGASFQLGTNDQANIVALHAVPTNNWGGGDFTVELWVKGIGDADLTGADATYGRVLVSNERLLGAVTANGAGWGLALDASGQFKLGSDTTRLTIANDLAWDKNTWYYIAMTADTSGGGAGQSVFTVYRGVLGAKQLATVGSVTLPDVGVSAGGETFSVGSYGSDLPSRKVDFFCDEVQFSRVVRPLDYLDYHFRGPPKGTVITVK